MKDEHAEDSPREETDKARRTPDAGRVLGKIPQGESDSTLQRTRQRASGSGSGSGSDERQPAGDQASEGSGSAGPTPQAANEGLQLPQGGVIAMLKSGGFRFTSREVAVYADGRVVVTTLAGFERGRRLFILDDSDLARLYRTLDGVDFSALPRSQGKQSPDAYAYEIIARVGGSTYRAELFEGSIPKDKELALLVGLLTEYMSRADNVPESDSRGQ